MEHSWNPAEDLQAIDRAHRLGQSRQVTVYRVLAQDTLEEQLMALHRFKTALAATVLSSANQRVESMQTHRVLGLLGQAAAAHSASTGPSSKSGSARGTPSHTDKNSGQSQVGLMWTQAQYAEQFDEDAFHQAEIYTCLPMSRHLPDRPDCSSSKLD